MFINIQDMINKGILNNSGQVRQQRLEINITKDVEVGPPPYMKNLSTLTKQISGEVVQK